MMKLGGYVHCNIISPEFEFGGHSPTLGAHPQNVAFCYDVGKTSTGCVVVTVFIAFKQLLYILTAVIANYFENIMPPALFIPFNYFKATLM